LAELPEPGRGCFVAGLNQVFLLLFISLDIEMRDGYTARQMLIVHVIVGLEVGGAELMLKRLIESYHGSDEYRHAVISLSGIGVVGTRLRADGVEVHALGMRSVLDTPAALFRLTKLIRLMRPDVVQTWMYHADLLGGLAARLAGNRNVIWGIRTTEVKADGSRTIAVVRKLCAWLSHFLPKAIICAAEASRSAHITVGYDASRLIVVPNGFDFTRLFATPVQRDALRLQCGLGAAGVVVVGYLGRFHPVKDQENFVRAAGLVAQRYSNVRFLMVGRNLDARNVQLAEWIKLSGFGDRFILLGERDDVPVCLAAMEIFCMSSRTEGFPNVVGEAMAMGLPCVVTDVGDARTLVADTGVVVPKADSVALAGGMGVLLAMTSDERRQLGQKARERIHAEFTIERAGERFESIYRDITQGRWS
jgi:glycosyltransferase involved in cell wall biosynthesis